MDEDELQISCTPPLVYCAILICLEWSVLGAGRGRDTQCRGKGNLKKEFTPAVC